MGALIALLGPLLTGILGHGFDDMLGAYKAHVDGVISQAQLKERLQEIMVNAGTAWVQSANNTTVQVFDSFQSTLRTTRIVQQIWAYFVVSQVTFIIFLELVVPGLYAAGYLQSGWRVGTLDTWAMGAVLACLGVGKYLMKPPEMPKV